RCLSAPDLASAVLDVGNPSRTVIGRKVHLCTLDVAVSGAQLADVDGAVDPIIDGCKKLRVIVERRAAGLEPSRNLFINRAPYFDCHKAGSTATGALVIR